MKVSDYVAEFISKLGVNDVFLISGGGMMHLLDSIWKNNKINVVCNFNEQATSICADIYGQYTGNIGVCFVTTGPGGTNAVTGVASAYLDSTPMLVISGQCKTSDFASLRGVRQFGAQEVEITEIVKPITKYAVKITNKNDIRYHLEKAVYFARNGRKGPVWVDIPLDIQSSQIDFDLLKEFKPSEFSVENESKALIFRAKHVLNMLYSAKRPLVLIGGGLVGSGARIEIREFIEQTGIPVLTTWRAKDIFSDEYPLYFGSPGIPATRYSNYILQNCDALLIIGTRLNPALTAYDEPHFAEKAKKVIIDIEQNEMNKLNMIFEDKICCDAKMFLNILLKEMKAFKFPLYNPWLNYCQKIKNKYPIWKELQPLDQEGFTEPYFFAKKLCELTNSHDDFAGASSGRVCGISHMAFELKEGQRFISSMGLGSMGYVIPTAIAMAFAGGKRVIALEGDGSLQHNLQELQVICNRNLPIKLFILSNFGYASIYMMQKSNFSGHYIGCDKKNGVNFPNLEDVAKTYRMQYYQINNNSQVEEILLEIMKDDIPTLCEVKVSINFDEIPKSKTIIHSDGTFSSSKLENLYPFLSTDEIKENMTLRDSEETL